MSTLNTLFPGLLWGIEILERAEVLGLLEAWKNVGLPVERLKRGKTRTMEMRNYFVLEIG